MAVDLVGAQTAVHLNRIFNLTNHDFTVSPSVNRTGHARFRRGPSPSPAFPDSHGPSTSTQSAPACFRSNECSFSKSVTDTTSSSSRSTNSSSLLSPLAGGEEASVSNGKQFAGLGIVAPTPAFSSRKPPLPSSHRKRCRAERPSGSLHGSRSENYLGSRSSCHCCKRRNIASKREIKRVPITGSKVTSVPADDYSWKKYGEKRIDGSIYPRVYYKCNNGKGCPARKSVEVAVDDSKMLVVTYAGEHIHHQRQVVTGLTR
ncbi:putative WRKY transcription factor 17 [Bidens hawaiensis]|uniref:putative WRKY transcription factor 17 n=1 Tax=Bidens hawaiensis TaxID=980011 RepID=UPI0040496D58